MSSFLYWLSMFSWKESTLIEEFIFELSVQLDFSIGLVLDLHEAGNELLISFLFVTL